MDKKCDGGHTMHIELTKNPIILARLTKGTHENFEKHYPNFFKPFSYEAAEKYYAQFIAEEKNEFYVLYDLFDGNEMTGFIWVYVREKEETPLTRSYKSLFVNKVVVHPRFRNRGYGKELLMFVENLAKEKGCDILETQLWFDENDVINFLEKRKFQLTRGIMWKQL